MKLRNKKTGVKGDYQFIMSGDIIKVWNYDNDYEEYIYKSLLDFSEEWEDYEPTEPLIKDEKIRRAVLAWSSAYNELREKEVRCLQYCRGTELVATDNCMCRITLPEIPELLHLNEYTIDELCGDE